METITELLEVLPNASITITRGHLNPYELTAKEFLSFAVEDSKMDTIHGKVNALSNAKRAIDCRIEELLYCYCLHKKSRHDKWDIPTKLQILKRIGILAPQILRKINKLRNRLEHQFEKPSFEKVEDAIDVVQLFIEATENPCWAIMELHTGKVSEPDCVIKIQRDKHFIELQKGSRKKTLEIGTQDDWITIAKLLVAKRKEW
jgi:hypothetical protein